MTSRFAYVGSRTTKERGARGEGISVFRVDDETGALELVQIFGDLVNPSYLTLNSAGDRLYSVHGDGHEVSVFQVKQESGKLTFLQRQDCGGRNPVYLALDPTGRFLVISDHLGDNGGSLVVMPVDANGRLGEVTQRVKLPGLPGPHRIEQQFSKPHANPFDPSGQFVLVPDKGLDRVFTFRFADDVLVPADRPYVQFREGAGPRHAAFHPSGELVYVVNELDSTVSACRFDSSSGCVQPFQIISTLAETFVGNSRAAGIAVTFDGMSLIVSNRGEDSLVHLTIEADGRLNRKSTIESRGRTPRFFALHPRNSWLYALNEGSDSIERLSLSPRGNAASPNDSTRVGSPVCMVFG